MSRIVLLAVFAMSCTKSPSPRDATTGARLDAQSLTGREWRLVELEGRADPKGAGGRQITLRFEEGMRAAGFAGCNQYGGSYTARGDTITFGPAAATRMACNEGMDVEQAYLSALPRVVRFTIADSTLTLSSADRPIARFKPAGQ
jgi:putative lipoprotein